jgi:hypothetical protein
MIILSPLFTHIQMQAVVRQILRYCRVLAAAAVAVAVTAAEEKKVAAAGQSEVFSERLRLSLLILCHLGVPAKSTRCLPISRVVEAELAGS